MGVVEEDRTVNRSGRRVRPAVVAGMVVLVLLAGGCTSVGHSSSAGAEAEAGDGAGDGATGRASSPTTPTVRTPVVGVDGASGSVTSTAGAKVSYQNPVKLVVTDGSFTSVQVNGVASGSPLDGTMSGDGTSWVSERSPRPASSYRVTATVKDDKGKESSQIINFTVAAVPSSQKVGFSVVPKDGSEVGIGQPIVIRFLVPVKERVAFQKAMKVTATTPRGKDVTGSWHWLSSQEAHWRPRSFWTPGTKVSLDMKIAGLKAAPNRYGRQDYSQTFTIGASHITYVDGVAHRVKTYHNGQLIGDRAGGTGKKGLETYSGTYIVLDKEKEVLMDSCSARITCDKKDPDYYSKKEYWATRITSSGTFLHAASWDRQLGKANVSHGCIHLSDVDARRLYEQSVPGDVVIVSRTGRGPQERMATQDPGLYDWNLPWSRWVAGSALR